jgi:hypothetical protein
VHIKAWLLLMVLGESLPSPSRRRRRRRRGRRESWWWWEGWQATCRALLCGFFCSILKGLAAICEEMRGALSTR